MARKQKRTEEIGDEIHLRGCIELQLLNGFTGEPVGERIKHNTVVTAGRRWVLEKIGSFSNQTNSINAIAVGTSTTAPATGDVALGSEITASVGRLTIGTFTTTNLTSNPPSWEASVLFATNQATGTLGEAALFNTSAATAGTMLSRVTFSTIDKSTSNTLAISYTISN
ncbi:MAG TPA: hypothetical protein VLB68_28850 [Pyrinomonadaceae bacterium]|nr:hypothetical protein [Pyrinomonadaceae bacterium]